MEKEGDTTTTSSHNSGIRRTRSQVAPDWSVQDSLILVNEVGVVELECKDAFASFQKWTIVTQNCNSLMTGRSLDQVRRRWESLLLDYNKIKQYQEAENSPSYWSMIEDRRKEMLLPESFDFELFKEISRVLLIIADTAAAYRGPHPDPDPLLLADEDVIAESGYKKQRQTQQHQMSNQKTVNKRVNPTPPEEHLHNHDQTMKINSGMNEIEQFLVEKLHENAEVINAIVEGSESNHSSNIKLADLDPQQIDDTRLNGDELIARLGNLTETLDKLRDLISSYRS